MIFSRSFVLMLLCLCCFSCRSAIPTRQDAAYASFASADNDALRFSFDWRMGLADSLRAGSALFFRFELPPDRARYIKAFHVVDRFASQLGVASQLLLVEGRDKTIGIVALAPEETASLPAGFYEVAVEIQFADGEILLSKLLPFSLLPRGYGLGETQTDEERRRFAALLQLQNDKPSYDAVAPLVVEPDYQHSILARLLQFYNANVQQPVAGVQGYEAAQRLDDWAQTADLSVREREISILALEEVHARAHGAVKNDR